MAEWNYHANGGAAGWGALTLPGSSELAFPDCNGRAQSPVDIPGVPSTSGDALRLDWRPSTLSILNTGLALQVDCEAGSTLSTGGKTYELQQFHFHTPSEHALQGSFGPLEVHFVHQAIDGELAVLGVLIDEGESNAALQQVLDAMPSEPGRVERDEPIDPRGFLPGSLEHYAYEGSLTTPPCTEGVRWHVLSQRVTASAAQIEAFRALPFLNPEGRFAGNARPVQPLNGRFGID